MDEPVLRRLRWWDIPAVLRLERALFAPDDWPAETFWSELAQKGARHYVLLEEGGRGAAGGPDGLLGYAGLALAGQPGAVEAYVQTLAVAPAAQRRGHGAALLRELLAEAGARGAAIVGLEVRSDNPAAQALYARAGFLPQGVRRGYYQPSGADATVMLLDDPAAGVAALTGWSWHSGASSASMRGEARPGARDDRSSRLHAAPTPEPHLSDDVHLPRRHL